MAVVSRSGVDISHKLVPRRSEVVVEGLRIPTDAYAYDSHISDTVTTEPPVPAERAAKALRSAGLGYVAVASVPEDLEGGIPDGVLRLSLIVTDVYRGDGRDMREFALPLEEAVRIIHDVH